MKDTTNLKFIPNNDGVFSIQVYIPIGSIHEKHREYGISHLLEHMKFRKSKDYSMQRFLQLFNDTPYFNAYTTKDHTSYYIRTNDINQQYKDVINIMYELIFNTSFSDNDLETEKKIIEEEKLLRDPDIESFVKIDVESENSILAPDNPYSRKVIGLMKDIRSITNKQLKAYNDRYFYDFLVVVSCSPSKINKVKRMILKLFPKPIKANINQNVDDNLKNTNNFYYSMTYRNFPVEQNNTFLIFKSYNEKDPNKYYLNLIKSFFIDGKGSILSKILREKKGFIYSIKSINEGYKHYGCYRIMISSNKQNKTHEILKIVFDEIEKLKTNLIPLKLFNTYRNRFLEEVDFLFKNNDYLVTQYGQYLYYDRNFTIDKYKKFINNITPTTLQVEIRKIFDFNNMGLVSYGNYKDLNKSSNYAKKLIDSHR